jgi:hypothetical protein
LDGLVKSVGLENLKVLSLEILPIHKSPLLPPSPLREPLHWKVDAPKLGEIERISDLPLINNQVGDIIRYDVLKSRLAPRTPHHCAGRNRFIGLEDPDKMIDPSRSDVISWNIFPGCLQSPGQ